MTGKRSWSTFWWALTLILGTILATLFTHVIAK
jgi:hypothetical protein